MVKQVLTDLKQELTCSRCKELFKEPMTLSCLHTFCEACLVPQPSQSRSSSSSGRGNTVEQVTCPLCNEKKKVERADPARDPKKVSTNLAYKNIVALLSLEERVRKGGAKCDVCVKEDEAAAFCSDCNVLLCQRCHDYHGGQKKTQNHDVVALDSVSSRSEDKPLVTHYTWKCDKHEKQGDSDDPPDVVLYCEDCQEMVCSKCGIVEPHGNHKKFEAVKIIDNPEHRPQIKQREESVEEVQGKFTKFIAEVKQLRSLLEGHQKLAKEQIEKRLQEIHEKLEHDKEELISKVDQQKTSE